MNDHLSVLESPANPSTDSTQALHLVNFVNFRPSSESLPHIPKEESKQTPRGRECHIGHDWWDIPGFDDPRCDELA
jgi:hypothetical protein